MLSTPFDFFKRNIGYSELMESSNKINKLEL